MSRTSLATIGILVSLGLLGSCATTPTPAPTIPIGQCNAGVPDAAINYPNDWPPKMLAKSNQSPSIEQFEQAKIDGKITLEDRDYDVVKSDYPDGDAAYLSPAYHPRPEYPFTAVVEGKQGLCEVYSKIGVDGVPTDIIAACSDDVFKSAAEASFAKTRFRPWVFEGYAITRYNVIMPVSFCFD